MEEEKKLLVKPLMEDKIINLEISIPCSKLDNNILVHLIQELKKKFEGRCIKDGYLKKINYLVHYEILPINNELKSTSPFFRACLSADVIKPTQNQYVRAEVIKFSPYILRCKYGPIEIICYTNSDILKKLKSRTEDLSISKKEDDGAIEKIYALIEIEHIQYSYLDQNIKSVGNFIRLIENEEYLDYVY